MIFYTVCQENLACASSSGHRPPPNSGTPPQKVLSSRPILMKQKLKDRSWYKISFGEIFFEKVFSTFSKKSKTKFSKKCEFWPSFFLRTNQKILRNPTFSTFGTILVTDSKNLENFSKFSIFFQNLTFFDFSTFFRLFRTF